MEHGKPFFLVSGLECTRGRCCFRLGLRLERSATSLAGPWLTSNGGRPNAYLNPRPPAAGSRLFTGRPPKLGWLRPYAFGRRPTRRRARMSCRGMPARRISYRR